MILNTRADVKKYGLKAMADYKCRLVENSFEGLQLQIDGQDVWTRIVGSFNAYNLLAVYAAAIDSSTEFSSDYYIALDALRVDNVSSRSPVYGLTGYTVTKTESGLPIIKNANTTNLVEFRFAMDVQ